MRSIADFSKRTTQRYAGYRPPLITFKALCGELGIKRGQLAKKLGNPDAPRPVFYHKHDTWYDKSAVKKWWNELNESSQQRKECAM